MKFTLVVPATFKECWGELLFQSLSQLLLWGSNVFSLLHKLVSFHFLSLVNSTSYQRRLENEERKARLSHLRIQSKRLCESLHMWFLLHKICRQKHLLFKPSWIKFHLPLYYSKCGSNSLFSAHKCIRWIRQNQAYDL